MADDVYLWFSPQGDGIPALRPFDIWQAVIPDRPEINSSCGVNPMGGGTVADAEDRCKAYIVEAWNRETPGDQHALDDFTFIESPPGWGKGAPIT